VGLGPSPGPQDLLNAGGFHYTEFIGVVGLGFNLTGSARVVGLGRLLTLTAYVGYMRCRLFL